VLQAAAERLPLDAENLMQLIKLCPIFDENKHALIEQGLRHYYSGDYVAATHILIPQIEAAIRRLAELVGANPYRLDPQTKLRTLRTLDDLLRDESVNSVLPAGVALYFRVLLTDQRGQNLRNNTCHGLLAAEAFGVGTADRVVHVLLLLQMMARRERTGEVADPGRANGA